MEPVDVFKLQKQLFTDCASPSTIFDVGANVGDITEMYNTIFPDCTIHCFEPIPGTFERLKQRHAKQQNIMYHQFAVGDCEDTVSIYETSSSGNSSVSKPTSYVRDSLDENMADSVRIVDTHLVSQITLDSFCTRNQIPHIDILKMDIQGSELNALKGASKLLDAQNIRMIYCEVLFSDLYEDQCYFHELMSFLHDKKYRIFDIVTMAYSGDGKLYYGDAIFINEELGNKHPVFV